METIDAVTRGLTHALGNRMFSVWSIGTAMRERPAEPRWGEVFEPEMARLDALLQLFRSLELDREGELEPIALPEALAVAVALLGQHPDLRVVAVQVPDDAPARTSPAPVLARRATLIQALLLLLIDAARESAEDAVPIRVSYSVPSTAGFVSVHITRTAEGAPTGLVRAARILLAHAGGSVRSGAGQVGQVGQGGQVGQVAGRVVLLPELGAARRAAAGHPRA